MTHFLRPSSLSHNVLGLRSRYPKAVAAALRICWSSVRSSKRAMSVSMARLSRSRPSASMARCRTSRCPSPRSSMSGSKARGSEIRPKARAALPRTSNSSSPNASIRGPTAPRSAISPRIQAALTRTLVLPVRSFSVRLATRLFSMALFPAEQRVNELTSQPVVLLPYCLVTSLTRYLAASLPTTSSEANGICS